MHACITGASHLVESDHLFERRANLRQGLVSRLAQTLAWLAPAAPAEQEEHGQRGAHEGCQRRCRCISARHALGKVRVVVVRAVTDVAIADVAHPAIWPRQRPAVARASEVEARGRSRDYIRKLRPAHALQGPSLPMPPTQPESLFDPSRQRRRPMLELEVRNQPTLTLRVAVVVPMVGHEDPAGHSLQDTLSAEISLS